MGTPLNGTTPQNTYPSLIKVGDNGAIDATLQRLSDGNGNDLPLLVSDKSVTNFGGGNKNTNTAFGDRALSINTIGSVNTCIGALSLENNTTGSENQAIGCRALQNNTTGNYNTANGVNSLVINTTASNNTAVGYNSLRFNNANNNTAIGYDSGLNITTGAGNVCIGSGAQPLDATDSNKFVVGSASVNAGSVVAEVNTSANVWNVVINGVARKILLA
jgi:hypothetical protein